MGKYHRFNPWTNRWFRGTPIFMGFPTINHIYMYIYIYMGTYSMGFPILGNIHIPYIVDLKVERLAMAWGAWNPPSGKHHCLKPRQALRRSRRLKVGELHRASSKKCMVLVSPMVVRLQNATPLVLQYAPSNHLLINGKNKLTHFYLFWEFFCMARHFIKILPSCMDDRLC